MASELKQKTAKGLAWGGTFSFLQQLASLLFNIIIARKLMPSDYGMVGMLAIFTAIATVFQESGFVFVLTNRKGISKSEYSTIFWFNIIVSFCIYWLFFLGAPFLGAYYNNSEIVSLSRYVFLGFFISSYGIVQSAVLYKEMRVKERGLATILGVLVSGIVGIILAYNGFAYWGLATQGVVSVLVSTFLLWYFSPFRPLLKIDLSFIKEVLPSGIKYAMPNLVSVISGNVYSLILGKFYTVRDVGYYSQATKFEEAGYSVPMGMVRSVSQPMLVQVKDNKEQLLGAFRKMVRFTAMVSIPVMLGVSLIAPELLTIILTSKWFESGVILRILCCGGAFVGLSSLASYLFISVNKSSLYMWLGIFCSFAKIVFALVASYWGGISLAIMCVLLDIITFVIYFIYVRRIIGYSLNMMFKDLFLFIIATVTVLVVAFLVTIMIDNIYLLLIARVLISIVLFVLVMNFIKYDVFIEAEEIVIRRLKNKIERWKGI